MKVNTHEPLTLGVAKGEPEIEELLKLATCQGA